MDHQVGTEGFFGWVTALVHANRTRLVRVVRREGVRANDALDCVQETFLSFLSLPQARLLVGESEDSARMLSVLARNIARNRRRRHDYARPHVAVDASIEQIASTDDSADELIARAERHALMLACIATLGEMQRAVVRLRLLDEVPGENVAQQLGVGSATLPSFFSGPSRSCGIAWKALLERPTDRVVSDAIRPHNLASVVDQEELRRPTGRDGCSVLQRFLETL